MRIALLLLGLLAVVACGGEDPPALRVGPLPFAAQELAALPASSVPALGDVAAWGLAVQREEQGVPIAPIVRRAQERSRLETLSSALGAQALGLGEAELRAAYEAAPEWELEVRHIIRLADADVSMEERLRALDEAEEVLQRARAGEDFAQLAAERSEEPGAAQRGGRLEPGREGTWVDPFWNAALALEPGEISPVVESEYGFHVLRLEGRQPVPFEEADRASLLRRVVPQADALRAMQEWAATAPVADLNVDAVRRAHGMLVRGEFPLDARVAAGEGWVYTGEDLAAAWAGASADARDAMLAAPSGPFESWLEEEVRERMWIAEAERRGAPIQTDAAGEERRDWAARMARWSTTLGFLPGMSDEALRAASLNGISARGQEYRIARQELEAIRPLLRSAYPIWRSGESESPSSSSEILKSESTG